jgi:hypothetical protein
MNYTNPLPARTWLHTQKSWFSNTQTLMMLRRLPRRFLLSAWNIFLTGALKLNDLQAQQFYLDQLDGGVSHRTIANRMASRFSESPAAIKDKLFAGGYIALSQVKRMGENQKNNYFFVPTGKSLFDPIKEKKALSDKWEDGTPKSRGNAFDLSTAKGLFTKAEIANSINKGKPNNYNSTVQVIAYSRA